MARPQAADSSCHRAAALPMLAALCALLACAQQCQACTQVIMGGPRAAFPAAYPDQVLSARNMGFFVPDNLMVSMGGGGRGNGSAAAAAAKQGSGRGVLQPALYTALSRALSR